MSVKRYYRRVVLLLCDFPSTAMENAADLESEFAVFSRCAQRASFPHREVVGNVQREVVHRHIPVEVNLV